MECILTNCVVVKTETVEYLCGEVVKDPRFPTGHFIRTTEVLRWDEQNKRCVTKSNTKYVIEKVMSTEDWKQYLDVTFATMDNIAERIKLLAGL